VITIAVKNQEQALQWFTEKLGFDKRADLSGPGLRWLAVSPKNQKEVEFLLASWLPDHVGTNATWVIDTYDAGKPTKISRPAEWNSSRAQGTGPTIWRPYFTTSTTILTRSSNAAIIGIDRIAFARSAHAPLSRYTASESQRPKFRGTSVAERCEQRRDLVVDGRRLETLYYPTSGDRPTIVMLHEGLGSVSTWKDFPEQLALATGCGVLAYSRYGHGKSERLGEKRRPGFMHHEAIIVLPALLDQLGIQDPILLGHSDGGSIAIIYVAASLKGPRALILEAPHVFVEDLTVQSIAKIRGVYQTTDLSAKMTRHHDHADEMFWGWNDIWLDPEFRGWNIEDCLDSVHCPVLTIQCANDEYGTLAQTRAIERRVRSAQTVVLQDCGHAPHRDQPAETLKAMSEFVLQVCSN
jgi:pimeloyl-ACP methyl ester carboxylesterase